jgi:hypothetical protein
VEHCYSCHSAEAKKLKGNLYLDSKAGWEKGGDSGEAVIIPGKPDESLLIRTVQHLEEDMEMPPKKPKLPDAVIADLVTWVKMGAPDPRDGAKIEAKRGDKSWWSLQPNKTDLNLNGDIDEFIEAKLKEKGLTFSPPADPRTLIRRMTYDLHGLPPTAEEVEAFVKDQKTNTRANKDLIERLLASPRYGERWGRHWLDVIRFGESNGFERNFVIDDLWPFRDYVIKSINDDKPFDQFITEHLAGDVIGKDNPQVEVGSAFLVAGPYDDVKNQNIEAQANIRAATLDDMITAAGSAFLGLTINCARCHNHKFDPIPMEDYYRLRAAFEGVTHGRRVVTTPEERAAFAAATKPLNEEISQLTKEISALENAVRVRAKAELTKRPLTRPKIDPQLTEDTFPPVAARYVKFVIEANTAAVTKGSNARLTEFEVWSAGPEPRNVALAKNGVKAEGARSAVAEDFPEAYGPQFCIDGTFGEQWFIGDPAELTITLAQTETISRIAFSNAKGTGLMDKAQGSTPCEYQIQVSTDGQTWKTIASGDDREPWTPAHGIERVRRDIITPEETATRIDPTITKHALQALRVLTAESRTKILSLLLKPENMATLAPIFPRMMTVLRAIYKELDQPTQTLVDDALIGLVKSDSYIIKIELNLAYLLQVLRQGKSQAKESLFVKLFKIHTSPLVRREIVLAMADWGHNQWISDLKKRFKGLSRWERRAYIVASYYLTDEGQHWRKNNKSSFEPVEQVVRDWFADRFQTNQSVPQ